MVGDERDKSDEYWNTSCRSLLLSPYRRCKAWCRVLHAGCCLELRRVSRRCLPVLVSLAVDSAPRSGALESILYVCVGACAILSVHVGL